jgi:hypothetical protein
MGQTLSEPVVEKVCHYGLQFRCWGYLLGQPPTLNCPRNCAISVKHTLIRLQADMAIQISDEGADDCVAYGLSAMQGWRISMEDAHAAVLDLQNTEEGKSLNPATPDKRLAFFGVYDGHGGEKVAQFAGENIHKIVAKQEAFSKGDMEQALKDGFLATDRAILNGKPAYMSLHLYLTLPRLEI